MSLSQLAMTYFVSVHRVVPHFTPSGNEQGRGLKGHVASHKPDLIRASVQDARFGRLSEVNPTHTTADVSVRPVGGNDWCTSGGKCRGTVATKASTNSYVSIAVHLLEVGKLNALTLSCCLCVRVCLSV